MSRRNPDRSLPAGDAVSVRPIRLFFDARYIRTDWHDGISRFSAELAAALVLVLGEGGSAEVGAASGSRPIDVVFLIHDEAQIPLLPEGVRTLTIHAPTSAKEPFSALLLNRYRPDVLFSPMQTVGSVGRRFRLILTLHDMIYYRHRTPPRDLGWAVRLGWRLFHLSYLPQRLVLNGADAVATVSETSRRQFARVRLTKRPVVVLSNAPQRLSELLPAGAAEERAERAAEAPRNIVYMGSFMPYKNVETLLRALPMLPDHKLHLLSRISPERRRRLEAVAGGAAGRVVFHEGVSDAEYAAILGDRAILATLSLDEGYGLPVAEAIAFGVPAVVSDLEIFHEVAGEGALYVPEKDAAAFARAVRSLDDPDLRARIVRAGEAHASGFSWERSAARLTETVRGLASE